VLVRYVSWGALPGVFEPDHPERVLWAVSCGTCLDVPMEGYPDDFTTPCHCALWSGTAAQKPRLRVARLHVRFRAPEGTRGRGPVRHTEALSHGSVSTLAGA
jgi:hypothetical protein